MLVKAILMQPPKTGSSVVRTAHACMLFKEVKPHSPAVAFTVPYEEEDILHKLVYVHFPGSMKYILAYIVSFEESGDAPKYIHKFFERGTRSPCVLESQLKPLKVRGGVVKDVVVMNKEWKERGELIDPINIELVHATKWFIFIENSKVYYRVSLILSNCRKRPCRGATPCPHNYHCTCKDEVRPCKHIFCITKFVKDPTVRDDASAEALHGSLPKCPGSSPTHMVEVNVAKWFVHCGNTNTYHCVRRIAVECDKKPCQLVSLCRHIYSCKCQEGARPCSHIICAHKKGTCAHVPHSAGLRMMNLESMRNRMAAQLQHAMH